MKLTTTLASAICTAMALQSFGQTTPAPAPNSSSLANSVGLMVYPGKGQDAGTQSKDEVECYNSSKAQSGYDPANPPPKATVAAAPPPPPPPSGSRVRGAARGAAAGAVVGEIANNDADEGAAVGAAAGAISGGRQARKEKKASEEQAKSQAQAAQTEQQTTFEKAMGTCLQGRGYTTG